MDKMRMRKYYQKLFTRYHGLGLNVKFMLLIILFIEVVGGVFAGILFWNMERSTVQEKITAIQYEMDRQHAQIRKNVDAINMSTQFFLNDQALQDFLVELKQGHELSADRLYAFYHDNIASMERMVNSNLYLYQIRVYAEQDTMQEMMPILYTRDRMNRLSWAQDEPLFGWKFNYTDAIFDAYTVAQNSRILPLVTPIKDYVNGELAVLEVAMTMDTMFEGMYHAKDGMRVCFVDESGGQYYGAGGHGQSFATGCAFVGRDSKRGTGTIPPSDNRRKRDDCRLHCGKGAVGNAGLCAGYLRRCREDQKDAQRVFPRDAPFDSVSGCRD